MKRGIIGCESFVKMGEMMKKLFGIKILVINLMILSICSTANATCKEMITKASEEIKPNGNFVNDAKGGSGDMQACVDLTKGWYRNLYKLGGNKGTLPNEYNWQKFLAHSSVCIKKAEKACDIIEKQNLKDDVINTEFTNALNACANENTSKTIASRCDGAAYLLSVSERDWENPEHFHTPLVKANTGAPPISCKGSGVESIDYEKCVKFAENGDILEVVQGAAQKGQELILADKTMTAQADAASSANTATASLQAQKTSIQAQEQIMNQRAALDSGKLALLATYWSDMPTYQTLIDKCKSYNSSDELLAANKDGCLSAVKQPGFDFLPNASMRDKMKVRLVTVGVAIGADLLAAGLLGKRAGDIDGAIAKVDAFKPIDPLAPSTDNLQTTFCQQNPGDVKCLTGGLQQTYDAAADNVITFGPGGTGTTYSNSNPFLDSSGTTTNAVAPTNKAAITPVGSAITNVDQKGGLMDTVAAATVTKGSAPAAGGGGGGGLGGGAGGGGGGASGGGVQAGGSTGSLAKAPSYGGGAGSLSMMGGFGINKSKATAKDDANPFGKLFAADAKKSNSIDFGRSPASQKVGTKGDNLFEMISKRYVNVNSEKRLLEYEMTSK